MKRVLLGGALALLAACGPSGQLGGRVIIANGDNTLASVMAIGPVTRAALVGSDGAYLFEGLPDGVYFVEASAPSTLEGRASGRGEVRQAKGEVSEITFVGTGRISGRVNAPAGVSGAEVFVSGTAARQRVADDGAFTLDRVPTGAQTLVATRQGYQPTYAKVNVPFNANLENQILALGEVEHGSGRISGKATFFNKANHSGITVTVEGSLLSAQTQADGSYTLTGVPLGYVNLVASAAGYEPARHLNVLSAEGGELRAPDLHLYHAQLRFLGTVYDLVISPDQKTALFIGRPQFDSDYYLYQLKLAGAEAPKLLTRVGPTATWLQAYWQADSAKAAVMFGRTLDQLHAIDLGAAAFRTISTRLYGGEVQLAANKVFYLDGTVAHSANPLLMQFDFGSGATQPIDRVELPGTFGSCKLAPWPERKRLFHLSADGRVAYHTPQTPGPSELKVHGPSGSAKLSGAVSCVGFRGNGMVLVALNLEAGGYHLVTYGTTPASTLFNLSTPPLNYGFSGDDQHAWAYFFDGLNYNLQAIPIGGGTKTTLLSQPSTIFYAVQPGGPQFAMVDSAAVAVKSATGNLLRTYPAPQGSFGFSPLGKRFYTMSGTDDLTINSTSDHNGPPLGRAIPVNQAYFYPTPFFSPLEGAAVWQGVPAVLRVTRFGGMVTDLAQKLPNRQVVTFSPNDKYALLDEDDSDRVFNLETGNPLVLGRNPISLPASWSNGESASVYWLGDGSKLLFREGTADGNRVLTVDPDSGAIKHLADYENNSYVLFQGSPELLVIDNSSVGQPAGLYLLTP